jgi:hypothetical protein
MLLNDLDSILLTGKKNREEQEEGAFIGLRYVKKESWV